MSAPQTASLRPARHPLRARSCPSARPGSRAPAWTRVLVALTSTGLAAGCASADGGPAERAGARRVVLTADAPAPVGPYSQGILAGDTLYLAGQIGIDPAAGALVPGGVEAEARQVLDNLASVLEAAGMDFGDVVQAQVFLVDIGDYAAVNAVYAERFGDTWPARAAVQVAALPLGARVEILMTAVRGAN